MVKEVAGLAGPRYRCGLFDKFVGLWRYRDRSDLAAWCRRLLPSRVPISLCKVGEFRAEVLAMRLKEVVGLPGLGTVAGFSIKS